MKAPVLFLWLALLVLGMGQAWAVADSPARPVEAAGGLQAPSFPGVAAASNPITARADGGTELAKTISQITGVAISPLLGTAAVGAWRYFETPGGQRAQLPWFAQPWFWIPALLIVGLVMAKDVLGPATPTALKKPIDVAEVLENKVSGLVATGAFVPLAVGVFGSSLPGTTSLDLGSAGLAAATQSQFLNLLLTPFAMIAFVAVFLLGHVINVLILISPFTTVDLGLKSLRAALLATVVGTSFASPTLGALWSLGIILVGLLLFGWSFRITVLGAVFLWDVFSRRRRWFKPKPEANWIFLARTLGGAPVRTLGRLVRTESGDLLFRYRPLLLGKPGEVSLPRGEYCVGRGFIYADLLKCEGDETTRYGILPPRYKGHEAAFTAIYQLAPPRDVGLRAVWAGIKEVFGFGPATQAAAAR